MTDRDRSRDDADPGEQRRSSLDQQTAERVLDDALGESKASSGEPVDDEFDGELGTESASEGDPAPEPEPEEALSQPFVDERDLDAVQQAELRAVYGRVRAFFKSRPERYRGLQRRLKQARVRDTYDEYLTDSARFAALAALGTAILTAGVLFALALVGVGDAVLQSVFSLAGSLGDRFLSGALAVAVLTLIAVISLAVGCVVWFGRNYTYPRSVVAARRRSITLNLPYAITFMYALSSGGMNFIEVCRRVADSEEVYGEIANEFDLIVREIDLFGNDLLQAIDNARTLTPSDDFRRFLDDLLGVLESGGDLEAFLEAESEAYLDDALEEQKSFIETLGVLSEIFVVAFVAAPLFLIVVLLVISFLGAQTVGTVAVLVYIVFPLGMIGFLLGIGFLSRPYQEPTATLDVEERRPTASESVATDPRLPAYRRSKRETGVRAFLSDPFREIRRSPILSLGLTVPAGIALALVAIWAGFVDATVTGLLTAPLWTTVGIAVLPLLVATGPLMALHELERRRTQRITERFPDVLSILASANRMGVDLVDGFELVARWATGTLAEELEKVRNDVAWNHDLTGALLAFSDRLNVPQLTRTMTLIAEGSRSSGDLHGLLSIAAADTRDRAKLDRMRRREVGAYVAIVVIGFLVYLLVIAMVSASYLEPIAELAAEPDRTETDSPTDLGSIPVKTYQLLFLHSALIQGFGSGLIAGKLVDNDAKSGLKYGLAMVALTVVVFFLLV